MERDTITDLGMGELLKGRRLDKHLSIQEGIIEKAQNKITNIKSSKIGNAGGQAKKIRNQNAIINNAQKEIDEYRGINNVINKTGETAASTYTTGFYNTNKKTFNDESN